jgi:hypothetical protein
MTTENTETLHEITHPNLTTSPDNHDIPQHTLSLYHTNIHSLPDKYLLLKEHLAEHRKQPDIITLSDNYLTDDTHPNTHPLDTYNHKHAKDISVYYKQNMYVTLTDDIDIPGAATIILQIHGNEQKNNPIHTIINIYRRPHGDHNFIPNLQAATDTITTRHPTTIITIQGDININLLNLTAQHPFTHFLIENNLLTVITTPTRYDTIHKTATLIDVILTQASTQITAGTISPPLSDHLPIYAYLHKPPPRERKQMQKTLSKRQYERKKQQILSDIKTAIAQAENTTNADTPTALHFQTIQRAIQQIIQSHEGKPKARRNHGVSRNYEDRSESSTNSTDA